MIELLDPLRIDPVAYDSGVLAQIREFSLLPNKRIGWNYCMDYTWIAIRCRDLLKQGMMIIDIGCGPGAIHGYLEDRYAINIMGIDMKRWQKDYVDIVGNFANDDLRRQNGIELDSVDLIISASAFEHNSVEDHKSLVQACFQCLKPGGHLITTFAAAPGWTQCTGDQWNLSRRDIENIYGEKFSNFDYWKVWWRWRGHREIPINYKKRYGRWFLWDPRFLSVGADIVK